MGQLGMGVMIGYLGGNEESIAAFRAAQGKTIKSLSLSTYEGSFDKAPALIFTFEDGSRFQIADEGQSCCESRYMTTDDDLDSFIGAQFLDAEIREGPSVKGEWGEEHEIEFLVIRTSLGEFTVETHNEHNGYYGGFCIYCRTLPAKE